MTTSTQRWFASTSLLALLTGGCVLVEKPIGGLEEGESEDGDNELGDGDGDGDSGDGDGDSGDGDGDSGDGDGDSGDGDGDSGDGDGDTGDGDCSAPEDTSVEHQPFDFGIPGADANVEWLCTVVEADTISGVALTLDCPDANQLIDIDIDYVDLPSFPVPFAVGQSVRMHYVEHLIFWTNYYLRLESPEGAHLLTLIDGSDLLPPPELGFEPPLPDMAPVTVGCSTSSGECGDYERIAIAFDGTTLGDPNAGPILDDHHYTNSEFDPATDVWVAEAAILHSNGVCLDVPGSWYQILVMTEGTWCGNGVVDPGEECDGDDLGGESCQSIGWTGGDLACADTCEFDQNGCAD